VDDNKEGITDWEKCRYSGRGKGTKERKKERETIKKEACSWFNKNICKINCFFPWPQNGGKKDVF